MLKALKFVQGAVAKKDFIPAMTHFVIESGQVRSYNGTIALSSPIPFDIDCKPKAEPLVRAISNCNETVSLSMTPASRLSIKSGKFKAFIDCVTEETAHVQPEGERVDFNGEAVLQALKVVAPFISEDASRPWSTGVLLKEQSAFATNNVVAVEYWIGVHFPLVVNVPRVAVKEMLRINEAPSYAQVTDKSITFHYEDGRWIRSQLYATQWPDMNRILDKQCSPTAFDERIFEALDTIKPFADKLGRVWVENGTLSTVPATEQDGASYEVPGLDWKGVYRIEMLQLLQGVAKNVDFTSYPEPCMFYGDRLRGAIVGMRP